MLGITFRVHLIGSIYVKVPDAQLHTKIMYHSVHGTYDIESSRVDPRERVHPQ